MNPYSTELCHHGILGMKWGKKNGPPYPLGPGDHSASEKKAGWRKSLDSMSNEELRQKINRKNLENQYQQYSSRLGESRATNNTLNTILFIIFLGAIYIPSARRFLLKILLIELNCFVCAECFLEKFAHKKSVALLSLHRFS